MCVCVAGGVFFLDFIWWESHGGGKRGNKKSGFPSWAALTIPSAAGGIRT